MIGAIDCGDLIYWSVRPFKCGVWDAGLIWDSYGQSCASQRMGSDKECMKGNYTYLNHTLLLALLCCSSCVWMAVHMSLRTHVCLTALFVRDLACKSVCCCVGCAYAVGVVRQYSHQAEQSGSINWWNSKPPASITIITNSSTQNVWLFLDKDSVLSAAILLMLSHFQTSAYDCN